MKIYPTGTCFDDSLEWLIKPENQANYLVHGICKMENGKLYSHAWCESENGECVGFGLVYDQNDICKCVYFAEKQEYIKTFDVQESTYYTYEDALKHNEKFLTYGPWEKKYLDLCRKA